MQPRKGKAGPGVIELPGGILPVGAVMTLRALGAEATVMRVLMTGCTRRAQSEKGLAQIMNLDLRPLGASDMRRSVTEIATEYCVLPLQHVASLFVIKIPGVELD
jgi:hypothetical protein